MSFASIVCMLQAYNTLSATSVVALGLSFGVPIAIRVWQGQHGFVPGMRTACLSPNPNPIHKALHTDCFAAAPKLLCARIVCVCVCVLSTAQVPSD